MVRDSAEFAGSGVDAAVLLLFNNVNLIIIYYIFKLEMVERNTTNKFFFGMFKRNEI